MKLLIDIGNSRLKWAVAQDDTITNGGAVEHDRPELAELLLQAWAGLDRPRQVAIASVAAQGLFDRVAGALHSLWPGLQLYRAQSTAYALGVRNAYQQPNRLGVDRWLALLAAHRHYPGNVCIVDCGTAITVDALNYDGQHLGGLIAPGVTMMRRSLGRQAAALAFSDQVAALELANGTEAAIANGCLQAATGLVNSVMQRFSDDYQLLVTGGDAELVASGLSHDVIIDAQLVFKGLAALADEDDSE